MTGKTTNLSSSPSSRVACFDLDELRGLVAKRLITERRHPEADLSIFNYTARAQYQGRWSETLLACRGLILDGQGIVVARGFTKFFNIGEAQAAEGQDWTVSKKHDGSLGIAYPLGDELRIATRGSFESWQAIEASELLRQYQISPAPGTTPLFEIILPENRVVVDYGSRRELILLAAVDNQTGRDVDLPEFSGPVTRHYSQQDIGVLSLEELQAREIENAEGWVVRFADSSRVKLKFKEYVRLHQIVFGLNAKVIWNSLRNGDDIESVLEGVPDEIFTWVEETRSGLLADYERIEQQAAIELAEAPKASRGEIAAYFRADCQTPENILFTLLDGKNPSELIWKQIAPSADDRPALSINL